MTGILAAVASNRSALTPVERRAAYRALADNARTVTAEWSAKEVALVSYSRATLPSDDHLASRGEIAIAFVGRLDNRAELKSTLGYAGVQDPPSDSALVLEAYLRWDGTFPANLRGDFVVVVWDGRTRRLLCARDPIGVRGLYYCRTPTLIVVASEIPLLLNTIGGTPMANSRAVSAYLRGRPLTEETLCQGILRMPAAHLVALEPDGTTNRYTYWHPGRASPVRYADASHYAEHFRELFLDSVRCRLADGGITGVLLSGGVDSSSIACAAASVNNGTARARLATFSAVCGHDLLDSDGDSADEEEYLNEVVRSLGVTSERQRWDEALSDTAPMRVPGLVWIPGLEVYQSLFEAARHDGIDVMLIGLGGDEILGADPDTYLLRYADLISEGRMGELLADVAMALNYYGALETAQFVWRYGVRPHIRHAFQSIISRGNCNVGRTRLDRGLYKEAIWEEISGGQLPFALEIMDALCRMVEIEPRYPFLDTRLIEFVLSVPADELCRHYRTKLLLRRATVGIVPNKVRLRTTKATGAPLLRAHIEGPQREYFTELIQSPTLTAGIDWDKIRRSFAEYCDGRMEAGSLIGRAIGLELWHRSTVLKEGVESWALA